MKKGSLAFLLTVCVILALMLVAVFNFGSNGNGCGKNLIWDYDPDTYTLTISGSGAMRDFPHNTADEQTHPWAEYDAEIQKIVIEDGVTYLGTCAFCRCIAVTEVVLADSVTSIGENVFWGCSQLSSVTIPKNVTSIGKNAFKQCNSLMNVAFLGTAPTIEASAFNGVFATGHYPANDSSWTEDIRLSTEGTFLWLAYQDAANIQLLTDRGLCGMDSSWSLEDGTLTISGSGEVERPLWTNLKDQILRVVIEEGITNVAANAFNSCPQLTEIQLPESLERIDKNAFSLNEGLTQIQIPNSVTAIGGSAFAGCTALTQLDLPDDLTALGDRAFYGCTGLTELAIPAGITTIGDEAFADCISLELLRFEGTVPTTVSDTAFQNVDASAEYPVDQTGWFELDKDLICPTLNWIAYCSGVHSSTVGTVVKEPSCTEEGLNDCVCPVCGLEYTAQIPTVSHHFRDGLCINCGYIQPVTPTLQSCYRRNETSIKVSWLSLENVDGYELFRAEAPDAPKEDWKCVKNITSADQTDYTNHQLSADTSYYYKIRSYQLSPSGQKIYSEFSAVDHAIDIVSIDDCYSSAPGRARLVWQLVEGATGYQVWRLDEDGEFSIVKTISDTDEQPSDDEDTTIAYSNTGLTPGETYTYKVRAFQITEDGRTIFGEFSEEVSVTVATQNVTY